MESKETFLITVLGFAATTLSGVCIFFIQRFVNSFDEFKKETQNNHFDVMKHINQQISSLKETFINSITNIVNLDRSHNEFDENFKDLQIQNSAKINELERLVKKIVTTDYAPKKNTRHDQITITEELTELLKEYRKLKGDNP
jgi:hypothetical protein